MDRSRHTEKLMGLNQDSTSPSVLPEVDRASSRAVDLGVIALQLTFSRPSGYLDSGYPVEAY